MTKRQVDRPNNQRVQNGRSRKPNFFCWRWREIKINGKIDRNRRELAELTDVRFGPNRRFIVIVNVIVMVMVMVMVMAARIVRVNVAMIAATSVRMLKRMKRRTHPGALSKQCDKYADSAAEAMGAGSHTRS